MSNNFTDCVWHRNGMRARQKAKLLMLKAAEPIFIVRDARTKMFGIGIGDSAPAWCKPADGFSLVSILRPVVH
jgi:hypothetical protein